MAPLGLCITLVYESESGGSPRPHFLQSRCDPILERRPASVVTQGREIQGGLWRTC